MAEPQRHYQPAWEQLKKDKFLRISAHKLLHKRIKKALRKEKDLDLGYKLECSENYPPITATIVSSSEGSIITFRLAIKPTINVDTI